MAKGKVTFIIVVHLVAKGKVTFVIVVHLVAKGKVLLLWFIWWLRVKWHLLTGC